MGRLNIFIQKAEGVFGGITASDKDFASTFFLQLLLKAALWPQE